MNPVGVTKISLSEIWEADFFCYWLLNNPGDMIIAWVRIMAYILPHAIKNDSIYSIYGSVGTIIVRNRTDATTYLEGVY